MRSPIPGLPDGDWKFIYAQLTRVMPKGAKYYLYGSRYRGTHKQYSDLDICIVAENIQSTHLLSLEESFAESDLPYKVDLTSFHSLDSEFQNHIKKNSKLVM